MIRLIGDVHGLVDNYAKLVKHVPYSIQLGDFGFSSSYKRVEESQIDISNHKIIPGNHDDYDYLMQRADGRFLYNYGEYVIDDKNFFFIRGAESVDKAWREPGISWWPQEELTYRQCQDCIDAYESVKPKIVLSHDCPSSVVKQFITNEAKLIHSKTNVLLQRLLEIHQPKRWFFGHHHQTKSVKIDQTVFSCLGELSTHDLK